MDGLYVYCLGRSDHPEPELVTGIGDVPVRAERVADYTVWVSDLPRPPVASLDGIRAHNAVVEAATITVTPLPFRFGQWFASRDDLVRSLDERSDTLRSGLDHVAGALEHAVRVVDPAHQAAVLDRASGTAYMEGLALRARADEVDRDRGLSVAEALRAWLGSLVRDARVRPGGGGTLVSIAYLVDRHDTGNYGARIREYQAERPDLRFLFTGPWPPYGFVE